MKYFILSLTILTGFTLKGQFSGYSLNQYQYGTLPGVDAKNFSSLYSRNIVQYSKDKWTIGSTFETYVNPINNRNYFKLTQFNLKRYSKNSQLRIGNFFETLNRGLLLRSYEITGSIFQDRSYRSQYYFYKDFLGVTYLKKFNKWDLNLGLGSPLVNVFPPTKDLFVRRADYLGFATAKKKFKNNSLSITALKQINKSNSNTFIEIAEEGNIRPNLSYYINYALNIQGENSTRPYAFYSNINWNLKNINFSLEMKDYQNFSLGSGFNEPPALIKQHTYRTLNRSTHVLEPLNEKGIQFETFISLKNNNYLTANYSWARNNIYHIYNYHEIFAEYVGSKNKKDYKIFFDFAMDPFKKEKQRVTFGGQINLPLVNKIRLEIDGEYQGFNRNDRVENQVFSLGLSHGSKYLLYWIAESTTDPFLTDTRKFYNGIGGNYKINSKVNLNLFLGRRRGGPACNGGICYEVLDFKGFEMRTTIRI
ncbi:MAG: hypothetical protein RIR51_1564 [Bacteroidota bacterium]|jgi:hypothetical protein